jgi:hypothetical protein
MQNPAGAPEADRGGKSGAKLRGMTPSAARQANGEEAIKLPERTRRESAAPSAQIRSEGTMREARETCARF